MKKGSFGYKAHVGVDKDSGIVHTLEVTGANEHDVSMTSKLLTGEEEVVYGDSGYLGAEKREDAVTKNKQGKKIRYKVNRRPSQYKKNSKRSQAQMKRREHEKSSVRAKVEHVFAVVKGQLRYRKTRYRGLRKQTAKLNMLFALANLILADRPSRLAACSGAPTRADMRKSNGFSARQLSDDVLHPLLCGVALIQTIKHRRGLNFLGGVAFCCQV